MATQKIRGLDDALKTLGKINPVLRRVAIKHLKNDVKPIQQAIKAGLPKAPLSNWVAPKQSSARRGTVEAGRSGAQGTPYWQLGKAKFGVRPSIKRQSVTNRKGKQILISMRQTDGAGEVFDMAGKKTNSVFTRNLRDNWGEPSRLMWPTVEKHKPTVLRSIDRSVQDMENIINDELRRRASVSRGPSRL